MIQTESLSDRLRAAGKACVVVTVLVVAVQYMYVGYVELEVKNQEEQAKSEQDGIGTNASITGSFMWRAFQKCSLVGVEDLALCESQPPQLIDDRVAAALAKTANSMRRDYDAKCEKYYTKQYCLDLLNRAFQLAQRRPPE